MIKDESGEFADPEVIYTYSIDDNNVFTIFQQGEEVYSSRAYRLRVQADTGARDWIARALGAPQEGVTLTVQNVSMSVRAILGGK